MQENVWKIANRTRQFEGDNEEDKKKLQQAEDQKETAEMDATMMEREIVENKEGKN